MQNLSLLKLGVCLTAKKSWSLVFFALLRFFWLVYGDATWLPLIRQYNRGAFFWLVNFVGDGGVDWEDVLKERLHGDTVVWFSALVMMATFLISWALVQWFSSVCWEQIADLGFGLGGFGRYIWFAVYFFMYLFFRKYYGAYYSHVPLLSLACLASRCAHLCFLVYYWLARPSLMMVS